jgi:hypothetical protein
MAPAASTTDECACRAAQSALDVRLVHVTPAPKRARARPIAPNTTTRARPQSAARAELLTPQVAAVRWEGARSAAAHAHTRYTHTQTLATHTRSLRTRARRCNPTETHENTHALTQARIHAQTRAHARTRMNTNTRMSTRALIARARSPPLTESGRAPSSVLAQTSLKWVPVVLSPPMT